MASCFRVVSRTLRKVGWLIFLREGQMEAAKESGNQVMYPMAIANEVMGNAGEARTQPGRSCPEILSRPRT